MGHGLVHVPLVFLFPVRGVPAEVQLVHWVVTVTYYHKVPGAPRTSAHVFRRKQESIKLQSPSAAIFISTPFSRRFVFRARFWGFGDLAARGLHCFIGFPSFRLSPTRFFRIGSVYQQRVLVVCCIALWISRKVYGGGERERRIS